MRLIAHEQPADPSARQGPYRASEEIQSGVCRIVIVVEDGAVDAKPEVITVRERAVGARKSEEQGGPPGQEDKRGEGLVAPGPAHDEIGEEVGESDLGKNVD